MKVLLVASLTGGWPFIQELRKNLLKINITVDVFDPSCNELLTNQDEKIVYYKLNIRRFFTRIPVIGRIINKIQNKVNLLIAINKINHIHRLYNIIEIHYITSWQYSLLKKINKGSKIILFYWGSDLYVDKYYLKRPTHELAEFLVFGRNGMANDFLNICGEKYKDNIYYMNFGLESIGYIKEIELTESISECKKKLGVPLDAFMITCGHNGRNLMQHEVIINNILKVRDILPENYLLIFPFTYRFSEDYYLFIKALLEKYGLRYKFILEFMSMEDLARLRIVTNLHINFVTTDSLNASMLENLFADTVVINGSWLKYNTLDEMNIFYVRSDIDSLFLKLKEVLGNYNYYYNISKRNKEIVEYSFSWEAAIKKWSDLYSRIVPE